jgi:predicted transcriptional regulator
MELTKLLKNKNPLILSLRETYFLKMLTQEKKFEYRKKFPKSETTALIYISKSKKEIVGIVEFGVPHIASSDLISELAESIGESTYQEMMAYLGQGKTGYAIPVDDIYLFDVPLPLEQLRKIDAKFFPPQSYSFLKEDSDLYHYLIGSDIKLEKIAHHG